MSNPLNPPRMFQTPSWRRRCLIALSTLVCALSLAWIGWKSSTDAIASPAATPSGSSDARVGSPAAAPDATLSDGVAALPLATADAALSPDGVTGAEGGSTADVAPSAIEVLPDGAVIVDLNTANEEELKRLPSVGPARAHAILELRRRLGRLKGVDDLARIKGFGRAAIRKLRPLTRASVPTPAAVVPAR